MQRVNTVCKITVDRLGMNEWDESKEREEDLLVTSLQDVRHTSTARIKGLRGLC